MLDSKVPTSAVAFVVLVLCAGCANTGSPLDTSRDIGDGGSAPGDAQSRPTDTGLGWGPGDGGGPPRVCTPGSVDACTTACGSTGQTTCADESVFGPCAAPAEDCNGVDDDCDGAIDEAIAPRACSSACGGGTESCAAGAWTGCSADMPTAESCDGVDEDCDSRIDEGVTQACSTACGAGTQTCTGGRFLVCSARMPQPETCNGVDDDCDGAIDNGLHVQVESTSYATLLGSHPDCDGAAQRFGSACNAAISRHCAATCTDSGFGPVENVGATAVITCTAVTRRTVAYAALATHHASCNGSTQRIGEQCTAAIHRYCVAEGFVSGYGPLENSGGMADVACVDAAIAELRSTTFTALSTAHPDCDASPQRWGADCNAAIHRWCRDEGFDSGFGPVGGLGNSAQVTCVRG